MTDAKTDVVLIAAVRATADESCAESKVKSERE
jgi:hypothetical protein